jgi:hypothetical protein
MSSRKVEISSSGGGGSIYYREGENTADFDWEFAASPALALIYGANSETWGQCYPWAAERQAEVFDFVAQEAVRQQAPSCGLEIDLEGGNITIIPLAYTKRSPA